MTMAGSSYEGARILEEEEESWQPERAGSGFCTPSSGRESLSERGGRESGRKSKKASKEGTVGAPPILGPGWRCMLWSRVRMKGECEGERGECEGEREGEWF